MTEQLAPQLTAEEAIARIAADIRAYPQRPSKLEEHLRLYSELVDREEIRALWAERYAATEEPLKRRKLPDDPAPVFILAATQPPAEPKRKPEPEEEPAPIDEPAEQDEPDEQGAQEERTNLPLRWATARNDNRALFANRAERVRSCSRSKLSACGDACRAGVGNPSRTIRTSLRCAIGERPET